MTDQKLPLIHRYVGRVVYALRRERNMRQSELAGLTGLRQPNLSRLESGLVAPRQATLERLATALGVPVRELLDPERARQVEEQWSAALTPRNAGQIFAGQISAVPLFDLEGRFALKFDDAGRPAGKPRLMLQLPPLPGRSFALPVPDDSMEASSASGDSFRRGEVVVFGSRPAILPGDYAFVAARDAMLFRKFRDERKGKLTFVPLKDSYPALTLARKDVLSLWRLVRRLQEF